MRLPIESMLNTLKYAVAGAFVCASLMCSPAAAQEAPVSVAQVHGIELGGAQAEKADRETRHEEHERTPVRFGVVPREPENEPVEPTTRRAVFEPMGRAKLAELQVADAEVKIESAEELRRDWNLSARYPRQFDAAGEEDDDPDEDVKAPSSDKFHWKAAFYQSMVAQGFQIGYALVAQEKTRRALKGPFFHDYWESVKGVRGWDDGNRFFTNYIAHPMQGSMTGFIYLQNHDRLKKQMFNESAQYWRDRARALVWSAAWSTNWEIGPIVSQSTIGNVGLYGKQGYVDLVITPTVGTAWMITEEALDRYIIRHAEGSLAARIFLRTVLNPTRSVANMLRFKKPWYRDRAD